MKKSFKNFRNQIDPLEENNIDDFNDDFKVKVDKGKKKRKKNIRYETYDMDYLKELEDEDGIE